MLKHERVCRHTGELFRATLCHVNYFSPLHAARLHSVSAFIGRKITSVSVINNEPAAGDTRQRQIRYDLNVRFDDGERANIEVMLYPNAHEPERMEYFLDRLHAGQEIKGKNKTFADLKRSWQLSIADRENFFHDSEYFHNFILYDPIRRISLGGLTAVHTLELNKLGGVLKKPVPAMSSLERWSIYFKYFTAPEKQGLLREILKEEEAITMATQVIQGLTQSQIEYIRGISRQKQEADYWQDIRDAEDAGEARGLAKGQKELIALLESGKTLEEAKQLLGLQ